MVRLTTLMRARARPHDKDQLSDIDLYAAPTKKQPKQPPHLSIVGSGPEPEPVRKKMPGGERRISLLVIDDNRIFLTGLKEKLSEQPSFRVVAASRTPKAAIRALQRQRPAVVLIDLGVGGVDILKTLRQVHDAAPSTKVIMMGLLATRAEVLTLVKKGVSGFLLKDASFKDFVQAIKTVAAGSKSLPQTLTNSLFSEIVDEATKQGRVPRSSVMMTERERRVVELIAQGMSNKEISKELNIATHTVKSHVHNILEKLSLHSRLEIAAHSRQPSTTED